MKTPLLAAALVTLGIGAASAQQQAPMMPQPPQLNVQPTQPTMPQQQPNMQMPQPSMQMPQPMPMPMPPMPAPPQAGVQQPMPPMVGSGSSQPPSQFQNQMQQQDGLANVNLNNIRVEIARNLNIDVNRVPISIMLPVTAAANVCGIDVNALTMSSQQQGGNPTCNATNSNMAFQYVQNQIQ
jgi:hypothetical protein